VFDGGEQSEEKDMADQKSRKITLRFTEEEFRDLDRKRAVLGKKFQVLGEELFLAQWLYEDVSPSANAMGRPADWPERAYPAEHQKHHEQLERLLQSDDPSVFDGVTRLLDSLALLVPPKALPKPAGSVAKTENEPVRCAAL
jgi:hypothetical protein